MNTKGFTGIYFIFLALSAVAGGIIGGSATTGLIDSEQAMKLFFGMFCLVLVFGVPVAVVWWTKADEAVREAHKWAWFWGGSIGMMLAILLATLNLFLDGQLVAGILNGSGFQAYAFEAGLIGVTTLVAYGYIAAWAIWWWKHR